MSINLDDAVWLNEPGHWRADKSELTFVTDGNTDFWRETYYDFTRDSGHFLGVSTGDNFTATVRIRGKYVTLYDQAGLMVRIDASHWVKAGVEFSDGDLFLSTVVTDGKSDWAVSQPFKGLEDFLLRITVAKGAMRIQASGDGKTWPLLRLAPFPLATSYQVGPTACSPERSGLAVSFSEFKIEPATVRDLHDLS